MPVELTAVDIGTFTLAAAKASATFGGTRPWWRGQRDAQWSLSAGLYRRRFETKEINLNARFRMMAKARRAGCPDNSDALAWLFLMQHYRLPTRLLDWSQSPLVALYFALEPPDDVDATVWALSPTGLNLVEAKTAAICIPLSETLGRLGRQAFRRDAGPPDHRILAVLTEESDARHMVQQSAFTIHGRADSIADLSQSEQFLLRIRVPAPAKEALRQTLSLFGVSRASLFPDLENLSLELSALSFAELPLAEPSPNPKQQTEDG